MEDYRGFYLAYDTLDDEISFSFSIGLHTLEDGSKDFQISLTILDLALAIGYKF